MFFIFPFSFSHFDVILQLDKYTKKMYLVFFGKGNLVFFKVIIYLVKLMK